jgi:uncharacterized protein YceK
MKKLLSIIAIIAILGAAMFMLTGCGEEAEEKTGTEGETKTSTNGENNNNNNDSGSAEQSLLDWMKSGKFSYDYTMEATYGGTTITTKGSMAYDNDKYLSKTEVNGLEMRVIAKDGKFYSIDDTQKIIMTLPTGQTMTTGIPTEYENMTKTSSGTGTIKGKTLPYEEYQQDEYKTKFYMEDGQIYALEIEGAGITAVMTITNAKNSVPDGAFDLPSGYTEY